jgi:hypothetical protein
MQEGSKHSQADTQGAEGMQAGGGQWRGSACGTMGEQGLTQLNSEGV